MACMEHVCDGCGTTVFNNQRTGGTCPKCGSIYWSSFWDEENCHDRDEDSPRSRDEDEDE